MAPQNQGDEGQIYDSGTFLPMGAVRTASSRFDLWVRQIPWRRKWQSTPVFLPGESHRQSLGGWGELGGESFSPWKHKELDMTEGLTQHYIEGYQLSLTFGKMLFYLFLSMEDELQSMGLLSPTRLSDFTFTFHFRALEKEMATHSSVLAWRIPGTGEPCGLLSMGSHRVGHDWSDLAAWTMNDLTVNTLVISQTRNS